MANDTSINDVFKGKSLYTDNIGTTVLITIIVLIAILTIAAMIWSVVCFSKDGPTSYKMIGIGFAYILGPLYWVYYLGNSGYCKKTSEPKKP